jgi:hypothetical protein
MRIAAVTAGLMVAGGIFGTIAGSLVLLAWRVALDGPGSIFDGLWMVAIFGVVFGGGLGVVLGPLAAWTLMRRVPLWLAVGGTTLGTCVSGGLTLLVTGNPFWALLVGAVGLMMSAAALNDRFPGDEPDLLEG